MFSMSLDLDDRTVFRALLRICKPLGIGPTTSIEAEEYFRKLLISYEGSSIDAAFESWLEQELAEHFLTLAGIPNWLQASEWPFANGEPLIFAGQIDYSLDDNPVAAQLFHDDTSIYVFIGTKMPSVVVMQQM